MSSPRLNPSEVRLLADLGIERVGGPYRFTIFAKGTILGAEYPIASVTVDDGDRAIELHGFICNAVNSFDRLVWLASRGETLVLARRGDPSCGKKWTRAELKRSEDQWLNEWHELFGEMVNR